MTLFSHIYCYCSHLDVLILIMIVCFMCRQLKGGELEDEFIKSCRIRTGRSVRGFCLPPAMCRAERRQVEKVSP